MIAFLRRPSAPPRPTLADRVAAAMCERKRVLFVDDSATLRDVMLKTVGPLFCVDLVAVESVAAARRALEAGSFAAAILDHRLTNGLGIDLYRAIVERWPAVQVVFLTAFNEDDIAAKVHAIGPARVYSKDAIGSPQFLTLLFQHLGIRRLAPEELRTKS